MKNVITAIILAAGSLLIVLIWWLDWSQNGVPERVVMSYATFIITCILVIAMRKYWDEL